MKTNDIIMRDDSFSSSEFIDNQQDNSIGAQWSDITPIPNHGHNALYRAKRYGRFFMLKTVGVRNISSSVGEVRNFSSLIYHDQLQKEFQIGVQLDHPNIAHTLYMEDIPDLGECIVMEYIDGETWEISHAKTQRCEEQKRRDAASPITQKRLFLQLLDAVEYLHSKQIVHRDLKPANILVTRNGQNIKLLDFGLSDTDDYAILKQPAGTRKYIAPEQLAGEVLDIRADIYSLGVIMKEVLPRQYRHIANKCTRQDKSKRYANCEAIAQAIRKADKRKVWLPIVLIITVLTAFILSSIIHIHQQQAQHEEQLTEVNTLLDGSDDRQFIEDMVMGWWRNMEERLDNNEFATYDEFLAIENNEIEQLWDTLNVIARDRYPNNSVQYANFLTIIEDVKDNVLQPAMFKPRHWPPAK